MMVRMCLNPEEVTASLQRLHFYSLLATISKPRQVVHLKRERIRNEYPTPRNTNVSLSNNFSILNVMGIWSSGMILA